MTEHEAYLITKRSLYGRLASLEYQKHEEGETAFVKEELVKVYKALDELKIMQENRPRGIF